jgi:hypothetical protein
MERWGYLFCQVSACHRCRSNTISNKGSCSAFCSGMSYFVIMVFLYVVLFPCIYV